MFTSFLVTMQKSLFAFGVKKITPKESEKRKDEERKETKNRIAADRAKKVLVKQFLEEALFPYVTFLLMIFL